MVSLKDIKPTIQKILNALSDSMNIEAAVFDSDCNLLASTKKYLERKGKTVHIPSLQEVLSHGNVLVNKPGHMPSCAGCRFIGHCPSTIEILTSIKNGSQPIGVISLTSFTKEGQKRLTKKLDDYLAILDEVSELITMFTVEKHKNNNFFNSEEMLNAVIGLSDDNFVVVDGNGTITYVNPPAAKLFPPCSIEEKHLSYILPNAAVSELLDGSPIFNKPFKGENFNIAVSSVPIKTNGRLGGAVIKIKQNYNTTLARRMLGRDYLDDIKGTSASILELKEMVKRISSSTSTVLITGETGTGKELFAKAIHYSGSRSQAPFVSINCASVPDTLFESELFGYEEGAFTGAKKGGKPGKFELAQGGTIFLDEIGEMPIHLQAKLLRVLQEYAIERVGGIRTIPVDVRVIAATNKNLEEMMAKNKFRKDLYYRLNIIPMNIPPLRQRPDDIEILSGHFLDKYNLKINRRINSFSSDVMSLFKQYDWPGNVRELENVVEYAVNMESGNSIGLSSLPKHFTAEAALSGIEMKSKVKSIELGAIKAALDKYGWDTKGKTQAAGELGISLRTLYRKIDTFHDELKDYDLKSSC